MEKTKIDTAFKSADRAKKEEAFNINLERLTNVDNDLKVFFNENHLNFFAYPHGEYSRFAEEIVRILQMALNFFVKRAAKKETSEGSKSLLF